jgi:hypothetical protein
MLSLREDLQDAPPHRIAEFFERVHHAGSTDSPV